MTISKISDTNDKKHCVVLSHFFVDHGQPSKFEILEYAVDFYQKMNYYVVLAAHGAVAPSDSLVKKLDAIYWEEKIDRRELGRGHPKFCIKGFEICNERGYKHALKMRAEDIIADTEVLRKLEKEIEGYEMIISEQSSLSNKIIGDLFMFGNVEFMLKLWSLQPWDYNLNGLKNLYNNFVLMNNTGDVEKFIKSKCLFKTPNHLKWVTIPINYQHEGQNNVEPFLWGATQGYEYYGGF